jgi:large subunit ribosomal protein L24
MGAMLDKPLREKYGIKNISVRKGDEVKIMRGKFKGKLGKVGKVDIKNIRIQIEGVQRSKKAGEKLETWFHPSTVRIISFEDSDRKRMRRGGKIEKIEDKKINPNKKSLKKTTKEDNKK